VCDLVNVSLFLRFTRVFDLFSFDGGQRTSCMDDASSREPGEKELLIVRKDGFFYPHPTLANLLRGLFSPSFYEAFDRKRIGTQMGSLLPGEKVFRLKNDAPSPKVLFGYLPRLVASISKGFLGGLFVKMA